jgi:hypothetical protein
MKFSTLAAALMFAVVLLVSILGHVSLAVRLVGLSCMAAGLWWMWTRSIPVGVEGREVAVHLTGASAVIAGLVMLAFGLWLVLDAGPAACFMGWAREQTCR